ncbi:MAG: phosphonoacetaldehyde reductase [Candidatus Paceibacterota bacterium]|jgi:alcohol dehydrogenase class IV
MKQIEYVGVGALSRLAEIIEELAPKKAFLVTGKVSYEASGAAQKVGEALVGVDVLHYTDFGTLPLEEDVIRAVEAYNAFAPDVVIAVGGGHVIDMAKAINFLTGKKPVVAIPTTAGTGSESTHFAVVYRGGIKHSLASEEMLPEFAIVDPELAMSLSKEAALPSALDALCQAIESFWSNKATAESRGYARKALEAIWANIIPALEQRDPAAIAALCIGAHKAGKAINISETTACHAFSYGLTYSFGVPHGIAAAIFLPGVYRYNCTDEAAAPVFAELNALLGCRDSEEAATALQGLLTRFGVTALSRLGVNHSDVALLAAVVNSERLGNNPRRMTGGDVTRIINDIV